MASTLYPPSQLPPPSLDHGSFSKYTNKDLSKRTLSHEEKEWLKDVEK